MKKKYLALALAASLVVSTLAGCGSKGNTTESPAAPAETTAESSADTSAEESTTADAGSAAHGPSSEAAPAWEEYNARIAAIRTETDLAKREALMHEAEDELMSTWAVMQTFSVSSISVMQQLRPIHWLFRSHLNPTNWIRL